MTQLSVNINKIATLRNARGQDMPNVVQVANDIIRFGAFGITVHPRPDERHIKRRDVYELNDFIQQQRKNGNTVEFNIEGYPSEDFLKMIADVCPSQCTLVPDPPDVITSNAGWNLKAQKPLLREVLSELKFLKVRSSLFLDPADNCEDQWNTLSELHPDRIELYTEAFAKKFRTLEMENVMASYRLLANKALQAGVDLNAGHDLNLENLETLIKEIPDIKEVSIGHALICESLYFGLETTIQKYLKILESR